MKSKILIIAPHADDEILGAGGTLLKLRDRGCSINWLLVTSPDKKLNWSNKQINKRNEEINEISKRVGFDNVYKLNFPSSSLDTIPFGEIVNSLNKIISELQPNELFIPHYSDVHTDHEVVYKASISSSKSFRHPYIKRIIMYETLSETEFGLDISKTFRPNLFVDIASYIDKKIDLIKIYSTEIGEFPFPRSLESIYSLSKYRGSSSGFFAAEAFEILKSRE